MGKQRAIKKAIALIVAMALTGCSLSPSELETFCRKKFRIEVFDQQAWREFKALVLARGVEEKAEPRLNEIGEFEVGGVIGSEESLSAQPREHTTTITKSGHVVARIHDFFADVDRNDGWPPVPASCGKQLSQLWRNA